MRKRIAKCLVFVNMPCKARVGIANYILAEAWGVLSPSSIDSSWTRQASRKQAFDGTFVTRPAGESSSSALVFWDWSHGQNTCAYLISESENQRPAVRAPGMWVQGIPSTLRLWQCLPQGRAAKMIQLPVEQINRLFEKPRRDLVSPTPSRTGPRLVR